MKECSKIFTELLPKPSANELLDSQLQVWSNLEELASRMVALINQSTSIDQLINKEESARSRQGEETFQASCPPEEQLKYIA